MYFDDKIKNILGKNKKKNSTKFSNLSMSKVFGKNPLSNIFKENSNKFMKKSMISHLSGASLGMQNNWKNFSIIQKRQKRMLYKDTDKDGVPNRWDCKPFNKFKQDDEKKLIDTFKIDTFKKLSDKENLSNEEKDFWKEMSYRYRNFKIQQESKDINNCPEAVELLKQIPENERKGYLLNYKSEGCEWVVKNLKDHIKNKKYYDKRDELYNKTGMEVTFRAGATIEDTKYLIDVLLNNRNFIKILFEYKLPQIEINEGLVDPYIFEFPYLLVLNSSYLKNYDSTLRYMTNIINNLKNQNKVYMVTGKDKFGLNTIVASIEKKKKND